MNIKMNKILFGGIALICGLFVLIGGFGLFQIYSGVPGAAAITDYMPWGLFIALFLFFEAVGCGALLAAALGKMDTAIRIKLALIGIVCSACAGLAILPDLGSPLGMWRLFLAPNVTSPLLLDVWFLSITLVFGILLFVGLRFAKAGLAKVGSIGAGVFSILLPLGTAVMFCSIQGKIGWESSAEIGIVLVQVLFAGIAAAVIVGTFAKDRMSRFARGAAILLVINLVFIIGETVLLVYRNDVFLQPLHAIMFGDFALLFWLQVLGGIVAPALMLYFEKAPRIAMGLGVAGIFLSKYLFVIRGSIMPTYAEMSKGLSIPLFQPSNGMQMINAYMPTMAEIMVGVALIGLAVLLILIAFNSKLIVSSTSVQSEKGTESIQEIDSKQVDRSSERMPAPAVSSSN